MRYTSGIFFSLLLLWGCARVERESSSAPGVRRFTLERDSVFVLGRESVEVWLPAGWRGEWRWYELRARAADMPITYNNFVVRAAPYVPERDTLSLELLRQRLIKQTALDPHADILEERRTHIAGQEAHEVEGHLLVPGRGELLHAIQAAFLTPDHHVVSVTLSAPDSLWGSFGPELERIRARIRLRHAGGAGN
jgi:hypothetical protein|nr:MAG: hypothetical protein KatS3mg041_1960 [Bacteroidota bacterium]